MKHEKMLVPPAPVPLDFHAESLSKVLGGVGDKITVRHTYLLVMNILHDEFS